jgi:hypothetical protein
VAAAYQQLQTFAVKEVDLVLIGDSLAQAFDESALSPLSVINLGVGGSGLMRRNINDRYSIAVSGHAAAAPPSNVMNSRRLMPFFGLRRKSYF